MKDDTHVYLYTIMHISMLFERFYQGENKIQQEKSKC